MPGSLPRHTAHAAEQPVDAHLACHKHTADVTARQTAGLLQLM